MNDFDTYQRNFRMMLALFGLWMVSMLVFQFMVMTAFIAVAINLDVAINYFLHQSVPDFSVAQQRLLNIIGLPFLNEKGQLFYPKNFSEVVPTEFLKTKRLLKKLTVADYEEAGEESIK
jgi:hypothetical protein